MIWGGDLYKMTNVKIAGLKTVSHWRKIREKLTSQPDADKLWDYVFNEFLLTRIETRYFEPIEAISKISKKQGKGFSIIAIYCSLIEFFETQKKGYQFHNQKYKDESGKIIKSPTRTKNGKPSDLSSGEVFVQFLTENKPFQSYFFDIKIAKDFYQNVRCAILHQAETTNSWIVRDGSDSDTCIYHDNLKNIYELRWKPLKKMFKDYLLFYREELKTDQEIQRHFIFKWDKIANL